MDFPVSGVHVSPLIPPLVAFVVSFFTSMGGVSGAFLLLPFQMSVLSFTSPAVSATNQVYNIVAIPSGVYRYVREGRMVWPLVWVVVAGTLPGVLIGAVVRVRLLPDPSRFKIFAGLVLLYVGGRMVVDLVRRRDHVAEAEFHHRGVKAAQSPRGSDNGRAVVRRFSLTRIEFDFSGQRFSVPTWALFALSFTVGVVGGVYGIGGGAIIAPFLVSFFQLPVYVVAGAALAGTCVTSAAGVGLYQALAPLYPELSIAPDWLLGGLFGIGGLAGMYLGARCQKHVPATAIKWMLAAVIVLVAVRYLAGWQL
jgi:uncharacterized membrane protein YfcA